MNILLLVTLLCISTITLIIPTQSVFASHCFVVDVTGTTIPSGGGPFTPSANSTGSPGGSAAPDPPSGITTTGLSSSSIRIVWNSMSGATSYTVYRASNDCMFSNVANVLPPEKVSMIGQIMKPRFTDSNLPPNTTFAYAITANNAGGSSDFSNIVDGTTLQQITAPDPPTDLTATIISTTQIDLEWREPNNAGIAAITGYKIERSVNGGMFTLITNIGLTTKYSDMSADPSTQYTYRVLAVSSNGLISAVSNSASATTTSDNSIPSWIKTTVGFWANGETTDVDFVNAIQWFIQQDMIKVPSTEGSGASSQIPSWIKNTAKWWSEGLTSDKEFTSAIQYLIEIGVIIVE